jgi:hypothetical protein
LVVGKEVDRMVMKGVPFNVFEVGAEALCDGFEFHIKYFRGGP